MVVTVVLIEICALFSKTYAVTFQGSLVAST